MAGLRLALLAMLAVGAMARTAAADDCYAVKKGTKLYAEVMANTVIGETTKDVIGWFGWTTRGDPTIRLRFVKLDGDKLLVELDAQVKTADATRTTCPGVSWRRTEAPTSRLTWPDGRDAGNAVTRTIAGARKKAAKKHGRACFRVDIPGIAAKTCVPVADDAKATCVAIASGKPVFARPSATAQLGTTTKDLVATNQLRVDDFLVVGIRSTERDFGHEQVYVKRTDTKAAACPVARDRAGATLGMMPRTQALLPDGTDAGFRITPSFRGPLTAGDTTAEPDTVVVDGRTLSCFDHEPQDGLRYRICVE